MIKYKIKKLNDLYILFRYIINNKSIGFYKVYSGTRKDVLQFIKNKNIKVGDKFGKK